MSKKETGGVAFPIVIPPSAGYTIATGMTLRDYFAAHATEEDICVALDSVKKVEVVRTLNDGKRAVERGYPDNARQLARYIHADALLKAREK